MLSSAKRQPGRPKNEALQERRREEILDKASAVFADFGYRNADVQQIAGPLGISKGTIYRYFPSKQELFLETVARGVALLDEHIEAQSAGQADPLKRLATAIGAYLAFFKDHPQLVELLIQERAEFRDRTGSYFQYRDAKRGRWREMFGKLMTDGRVRTMPVEKVMSVLGDLVYGTMFTNYFAGRDISSGEQAANILDVLFNGILTDRERERASTKRE
jgi:AcrR family transcriptional regulator